MSATMSGNVYSGDNSMPDIRSLILTSPVG